MLHQRGHQIIIMRRQGPEVTASVNVQTSDTIALQMYRLNGPLFNFLVELGITYFSLGRFCLVKEVKQKNHYEANDHPEL
jgi:hypothetical protein